MASPVTGSAVATCRSPMTRARNSGSHAHQACSPIPARRMRCGISARARPHIPVTRPRSSRNTAGQDRSTGSARARGIPAGYRDYEPAILERLAFIRHAQAAGLTLNAIGQVLDIGDGGQPPCVHVAGLIARRLTEVEARLAELARTRDQLVALAARATA